MSNQKAEIVPFGKYKGKPVEALVQDKAYCDWLIGQDWFRSRFTNIHTLIINNFGEPDETPEHNALQAKFLDEEWVKSFVTVRRPLILEDEKYLMEDLDRTVEDTLEQAEKIEYRISVCLYEGEKQKLHSDLDSWRAYLEKLYSIRRSPKFVLVISDRSFEEDGIDVKFTSQYRLTKYNWRSVKHYVDCKPTLSDDYPAVLRQVRASAIYTDVSRRLTFSKLEDRDCLFTLLIGEYTGVGATLEQVRRIFLPIAVLTVAEIVHL